MYEAFHGLSRKPFTILPDPTCVFPARGHRAAMAMLEHAVCERSGFTIVTGGIGTGKTTLVRRLILQQPRGFAVGLVANPHESFGPLVGRALLAFGIEAPDGQPLRMIDQFHLFVEELARAGRRALLIVDEAHVLNEARLEELRMLSNAVAEERMPHVVLVGQPGLRDTLASPRLEPLAQRVVGDCVLEPLARDETHRYIAHRLQHAGGNGEILDAGARDAVHDYAVGIPRLINTLCEDAMILGSLAGRKTIDGAMIHSLARDRRKSGILPLDFSGAHPEPDFAPHSTSDGERISVAPRAVAI